MYARLIKARLTESLADTPAILLVGPRRAGKTTLVRAMNGDGREYVTLDNRTALAAAREDPVGFVRGLDRAVIDEVQRAPELMLSIKQSIDEDYRPGRFLLTGSANVLTLPRVADSLAGRMETIRLLPLARVEILGRKPSFLESLYSGRVARAGHVMLGDELIEAVLSGGYPEALHRETERRRHDWARSYVTSLLTRDLRDIAEIERLTELPKFVRLLAEHSGNLVNYSALGAGIDVTYKTGQRYVTLLEQLFLIATLHPWYTNSIKRIVKTPKLHFLDSGVLAATRGLGFDRIKNDRAVFGAVLETFVFSEIMKLMTWSDFRITPFHFRDQEGHEVDIVLERDDNALVGIEVKASATVTSGDFSGLKKLADAAKKRFVFGVVLYDGDTIVPFGERLAAAPLSCLWS